MTTDLPRRRFLALTGGAALAGGLGSAGLPAEAAPRRALASPPLTIPNLRQWTAGSGAQYAVPAATQTMRVIVRGADAAALSPVAAVLKAELSKLLRRGIGVEVQDTPAPAAGDIVLRQALISGLNQEGYEIAVASTLELRGPRAGVFHGAQTIIQWLRQATTVPAGVARDQPRYPERGFLVANAARHYSMEWWKGQLQEMAYLKLNLLWVNVGYDTAPLTEMQELAAAAAKYNINLVPLTSMPGHMRKLLANRPDIILPGWPFALDLSKDAAYEFARNDVLAPNLPGIQTPYWHLGADEYLAEFGPDVPVRYDLFPQLLAKARERFGPTAQAVDVFTGFLNDMNVTVRAAGKQMRIWNDGLLNSITAAPLDKNIIVEHWVTWPNRKKASQLLAEGYQLQNSNGDFLYYDPPTHENPRRVPDARRIYNEFHPGWFSGNEIVDRNHAGLRGAKLHLWTLPATDAEELQSDLLIPAFRALSQVLWGGTERPFPDYDSGFAGLITTIGRMPTFPVGRRTFSPVHGATSVWPHRPAKVTFYDDVDPATVQLREGGTEAGTPGRTTYDPATRTATFTPSAPWQYSKKCAMTFTARTRSGEQFSGEWSFAVAKPPSLAYPRSLWPDEEGPHVEFYSDLIPSELGVRFRVDRPGLVLGVKFYKAPGDTGEHTGGLWNSAGQKLATATFTNESAQGWQEVRFGQPVRIEANTTYTASYHSPTGTFGFNHNFFGGDGVHNGVIHALPGTNGFYAHGPSAHPAHNHLNTNYWADVIFQPDTYTLWNVGDAPVFGDTEPTALELGLRFASSAGGRVHGVRFFKGTHNTGTHVGSLWTAAGQKLASATFTSETASGWQEVRFAQPITIQGGADYVVSYSSQGGFSTTEQGLATVRQNGALFTRTSPPAGVFAVGAGTFPTRSYQNRNYYVDVVYSEG